MRPLLPRRPAGGAVLLAVATAPELIDPQKFGVTVARDFGATAELFTSGAEALTRLQDEA